MRVVAEPDTDDGLDIATCLGMRGGGDPQVTSLDEEEREPHLWADGVGTGIVALVLGYQ